MALEHAVEDAELHAHAFLDVERQAGADRLEGDVQAGRRLLQHGGKRLGGEFVGCGRPFEARHDIVERTVGEMAGDGMQGRVVGLARHGPERLTQFGPRVAGLGNVVEQAVEVFRFDRVRRQPRP